MDYKNKYLKYKNKYLNLLSGGTSSKNINKLNIGTIVVIRYDTENYPYYGCYVVTNLYAGNTYSLELLHINNDCYKNILFDTEDNSLRPGQDIKSKTNIKLTIDRYIPSIKYTN